MHYLERYTPEQARRHEGAARYYGWAQINGRQTIYFSKRLELDVWYVDHVSLGLDLKILLLTIPRALASSGVVPVRMWPMSMILDCLYHFRRSLLMRC